MRATFNLGSVARRRRQRSEQIGAREGGGLGAERRRERREGRTAHTADRPSAAEQGARTGHSGKAVCRSVGGGKAIATAAAVAMRAGGERASRAPPLTCSCRRRRRQNRYNCLPFLPFVDVALILSRSGRTAAPPHFQLCYPSLASQAVKMEAEKGRAEPSRPTPLPENEKAAAAAGRRAGRGRARTAAFLGKFRRTLLPSFPPEEKERWRRGTRSLSPTERS